MKGDETMKTSELLDEYTNWLRKQYTVKDVDVADEITTPFLNTIGDNLRIYVKPLDRNQIELSDDGITLEDLYLLGIDMNASVRKDLLDRIKNEYLIKQRNDTLYVKGSIKNFPLLKQNFISAIIKINDIANTRRPNVESLFFDEVYKYFDENDFGGLQKHPFEGKSGVSYNLDYVIPKKNNRPTRMIDLQNRISFNQVMTSAYKFQDIRENRTVSTNGLSYTMIFNNDASDVSSNSIKIAQDADIRLIPWSNKMEILALR